MGPESILVYKMLFEIDLCGNTDVADGLFLTVYTQVYISIIHPPRYGVFDAGICRKFTLI